MPTTHNAATAAAAAAAIKNLRYGIEIETVGRERKEIAEAIATALGGTVAAEGGHYDKWCAVLPAPDGRKWTVMSDGSLTMVNGVGGGAEVVSPILTYADDEMLQRVVRVLRTVGARVDASCSIHVHVDGAQVNAAVAGRLLRLVYRRERQLQRALGCQPARLARFCKELDAGLIGRLDARRPTTLDALAEVWYGERHNQGRRGYHYDGSRYAGLNLHSLYFRGTCEARWFEATLHAGKVRAYTLLARALVAIAIVGTDFCDVQDSLDATEAESFAGFLDAIGLGADEFETYREHLTGHLLTQIASASSSLRDYAIQHEALRPTPRPARPVAPAPTATATTTATASVPAMRLPADDPREPNLGRTLVTRRRNGDRIAVTRLADGRYRVDSAVIGNDAAVGTIHRSLSGAASAATGCRTNGYALFDLGDNPRAATAVAGL